MLVESATRAAEIADVAREAAAGGRCAVVSVDDDDGRAWYKPVFVGSSGAEFDLDEKAAAHIFGEMDLAVGQSFDEGVGTALRIAEACGYALTVDRKTLRLTVYRPPGRVAYDVRYGDEGGIKDITFRTLPPLGEVGLGAAGGAGASHAERPRAGERGE